MKATKAMKTIKVSEAKGSALNWLVANCEGHEIDSLIGGTVWYCLKDSLTGALEIVEVFNPSTEWSQGGPIIERERITVNIGWFDEQSLASIWVVSGGSGYAAFKQRGPTPLIAAMRCYVASKLGATVEVPDELL